MLTPLEGTAGNGGRAPAGSARVHSALHAATCVCVPQCVCVCASTGVHVCVCVHTCVRATVGVLPTTTARRCTASLRAWPSRSRAQWWRALQEGAGHMHRHRRIGVCVCSTHGSQQANGVGEHHAAEQPPPPLCHTTTSTTTTTATTTTAATATTTDVPNISSAIASTAACTSLPMWVPL